MGRYDALPHFLGAQKASMLRLTFDEVEAVLGRSLPPSAFRHQAWWANNPEGHSHCRAWIGAGWKTENVDLGGKKLTFRKIEKERSSPASSPPPTTGLARTPPKPGIIGRLRGTVTIIGDITEPTGDIWNAEQGIL